MELMTENGKFELGAATERLRKQLDWRKQTQMDVILCPETEFPFFLKQSSLYLVNSLSIIMYI